MLRRFCVHGDVIDIELFTIISVDVFLRRGVGVFLLGLVSPRFSPNWNVVPEIKRWNSVHAKTSVHQIRLNCGILKFVSYTSNLWEQMFEFRKYIRLSPKLISDFQGPQQSLSLGTIPIDSGATHHPRGNFVSVTARASLFTDQRTSSLPILAKYRHFTKI